MGFPTVSRAGNIIVNPSGAVSGEVETPLRCAAWWILDLSPVWGFPALRGENTILPTSAGRFANPLRYDQGVYVMPFRIVGDVNRDGVAHSDPLQGLYDNLADLKDNVCPGLSATRLAKLITPDASAFDGIEVQVKVIPGVQSGSTLRAVVEVIVPEGRFA